jgi:hypothetical protein
LKSGPVFNVSSDEQGQAHAIALRNAQPLDLHLSSDAPEVLKLAMDLMASLPWTQSPTRRRTTLRHLVVVLLNLYSARLNDPERYVRYSRRPGNYKRSRYNTQNIGYRPLIKVIDVMQQAELVEHSIGIPGRVAFDVGKQSRVRASTVLSERFRSLREDMIQRRGDEVIILKGPKDAKGSAPFVDYRDTKATREMRDNLNAINARIANACINLYVSDLEMQNIAELIRKDRTKEPIDFRQTTLRRIFNDRKWNHGGRFYNGWWQNIPKKYRGLILINSRQTAEIDFSGIHIVIFYADAGQPTPTGDPYELPGAEVGKRSLVKRALNILINADSRATAIHVIADLMEEEGAPAAYPTADRLVAGLEVKHAPIANAFGSGAGIRAQCKDAKIAEKVMLKLGERGIVALPIHDSFIVEERCTSALFDAMRAAFVEGMGRRCKVKNKLPPWMSGRIEQPEHKVHSTEQPHREMYRGYYRRDLACQRKMLRAAKAAAILAKSSS